MIIEAARTGNVKDFKRAISDGCDLSARDGNGETVLSIVAKVRPDLVRLLIENGVDVNHADDSGITPLHWAVEYDNEEAVRLLLDAGACTESSDSSGETPLHWAAWTGHAGSAALLLRYGADVSSANVRGVIPHELALQQEHYALARLLKPTTGPA